MEGAKPLPDDTTCADGQDYWYERTAYRKIPYSTCEGGKRPDQGLAHFCPGIKGHSGMFWFTFLILPFAFTALVAYWYYRRGGFNRGCVPQETHLFSQSLLTPTLCSAIRLPDSSSRQAWASQNSDLMETVASIPWFLLGLAGVAYAYVTSIRIPFVSDAIGSRRGYRNVPIDEDAQVLRFEDED